MYSILRSCSAAFFFLFLAATGYSQAFNVIYDFSAVTTTSGKTDPTPVPTAPGVDFGSFSAVTPTTNPNAGGRFSFTGWPTGATNASDEFTGTINTGQYYQVTLTPQPQFSLSLTAITFTVQRSGTGIRQYAVRSSANGFADNLPATTDPANPNLKVVAGNIFQVSDAATAAQDGNKITLSGFAGSTAPVTFRFYGWNAEAAGGTFSIDNVQFTGAVTIAPDAPALNITPGALNFPAISYNTVAALSYTLQGDNLTDPVMVTATAPFSVSADSAGTFTTSLTIPVVDIITAKTVYVHFSPLTTGVYNGTISNTSTGAAAKTVGVSGEAIDSTNLSFGFNTCSTGGTPGGGFISRSVSGAQQWICSNFGLNGSRGVEMNGYSGGAVENEDWLISPPLLIGSLNLPILKFWSRGEFTGPSVQLLVSTDYDGNGNPGSATWTDLQASFPALTNTWTLTDGINLLAYKGSPKVFVAFRYTSSPELGAARWTLDNVEVTDRTTLLSAGSTALNFGEVTAGGRSSALPVNVQAFGYNDITATVPDGFELSADSLVFSGSIVLSKAVAEAGTTIYVRYSPVIKALKTTGVIRFTGSGLDSNLVILTGSSYPKSETFDVAAYNLSFFGSNPTNNPTPEKITTQINNITTVLQRLNMDVLGVEEVSSDSAIAQLTARLPGYASVMSKRWSYSFDPPDPGFPPQKVGFIYNTATLQLLEQRVMFEGLYDSVRNNLTHVLDDYPTGNPSSFWSSGRLPFMATFRATINGVSRLVRIIDIHAKSASDAESYNRRVYDVKALKDTLDAYYQNDNIILLGDYNDRLSGSINAGAQSPYKPFVDDQASYTPLTLPLDQAGRVSFITGTGLIDHIITSNELNEVAISNATDIEDPRTYISGYNATTASDHLPVFTRFNFSMVALPVKLTRFQAKAAQGTVVVNWTTANEVNNSYYMVERSKDGINFTPIARVNGAGTVSGSGYQFIDSFPLAGINYYRLRQADLDGRAELSQVVSVRFLPAADLVTLQPNPVTTLFNLHLNGAAKNLSAQVTGADGTLLLQAKGDINQVNQEMNRQLYKLKAGVYILLVTNASEKYSIKFVRK